MHSLAGVRVTCVEAPVRHHLPPLVLHPAGEGQAGRAWQGVAGRAWQAGRTCQQGLLSAKRGTIGPTGRKRHMLAGFADFVAAQHCCCPTLACKPPLAGRVSAAQAAPPGSVYQAGRHLQEGDSVGHRCIQVLSPSPLHHLRGQRRGEGRGGQGGGGWGWRVGQAHGTSECLLTAALLVGSTAAHYWWVHQQQPAQPRPSPSPSPSPPTRMSGTNSGPSGSSTLVSTLSTCHTPRKLSAARPGQGGAGQGKAVCLWEAQGDAQ